MDYWKQGQKLQSDLKFYQRKVERYLHKIKNVEKEIKELKKEMSK